MKYSLCVAFCLLVSILSVAQQKQTLTVNFDFDRYDLTPEATTRLDDFIERIHPDSASSIQLSGYCDSKGSDDYNDALSLKRALAVKNHLESKNITATISAKGFGENGLLNKDDTEEAGRQNRRVEITASVAEQHPKVVANKEPKTLTAILEDSAVKKGDLIAIPNLEFENNSDVLLSKSVPTLQELFGILAAHPKMKISIEGHICCVPYTTGVPLEHQPNFRISVIRAKMVYEYLLERGIDPMRISYTAFGNSRPIFPIPERSEEERSTNRRVEIRILDK